jgi:hypothetical protein
VQCEGKGTCITRDACHNQGGQVSSFTCPGEAKLFCCTDSLFGDES